MTQFESLKDQIAAAGATVLYLAAEKRGGWFKPARHLEKNPVSFPFLLDEDRNVTRSYGLFHRLGTDAFNIAHPATLVVDRGGVVGFIYRGDNQTDRAPMEQVLDAVRKLVVPGGGRA